MKILYTILSIFGIIMIQVCLWGGTWVYNYVPESYKATAFVSAFSMGIVFLVMAFAFGIHAYEYDK